MIFDWYAFPCFYLLAYITVVHVPVPPCLSLHKLLNKKVDVDDKEYHYGWTALMFAAYQVGIGCNFYGQLTVSTLLFNQTTILRTVPDINL